LDSLKIADPVFNLLKVLRPSPAKSSDPTTFANPATSSRKEEKKEKKKKKRKKKKGKKKGTNPFTISSLKIRGYLVPFFLLRRRPRTTCCFSARNQEPSTLVFMRI